VLANPPVIARLLGVSRQLARRRTARGDFGPVKRGLRGTLVVTVSGVELGTGLRFSDQQLELVGLRRPIEEDLA